MRALVVLAALMCALCAAAMPAPADSAVRPLRPVLSAFTVEYGSARAADTYLTPLHYKGAHWALGYERMQAPRFDPQRCITQLDGRLQLDRTLNPARNSAMLGADIKLAYTVSWRMPRALTPGLTLAFGGGPSLTAGALALMRNGNNPVSARGAVTLDARATADYSFRPLQVPVTVRWQVSTPLTGVFFSPDYGQLYYEIWLGERAGLVRGAWWGNYFGLDNYVSADIRLGGTALRVGYRGTLLSTSTRGIVTRSFNHAVVLGVAVEWLSLSPRTKMNTPTIWPLYAR